MTVPLIHPLLLQKMTKVDINNGSNIINFTYHAEGRLVEAKDKNFMQKFIDPFNRYNCEIFKSATTYSYQYLYEPEANGYVKRYPVKETGSNPGH